MAVPLKPKGPMPDDEYNGNIGKGGDLCMKCDHPIGFHSASENTNSVKCHLGACNCSITYEEAMDRAAEIRGDLEQLKHNARQKMERLQKEAADRVKLMPRYVHGNEQPYSDSRFLAVQAELRETQRRYAALLEQASRRAEMEVRPIYIHRTVDGGVVPQDFGVRELPSPGQIWIENEDVYINQQEQRGHSPEKVVKPKAVKPEPPHRRVVKLPKRGK